MNRSKKVGIRDFSMMIALILTALFFQWRDPAFLSTRNLSQLAIELSATAVLALGMLLIIVCGHIDLSVGSGVGLARGVAAVLITRAGFVAPLGLLLTTCGCVLVYGLMGAVIVKEKVPAFIITLGGLLIFKGAHWLVIESQTVPVVAGGGDNSFSRLTTDSLPAWASLTGAGVVAIVLGVQARRRVLRRKRQGQKTEGEEEFLRWFVAVQVLLAFVLVMQQYRGVPLAVVLLAVVALAVHLIITRLRLGRYLLAVGGNEEAARVSGVPTDRVVITAFALMGLLVAVAGFLQTAFAGASTTTTGQLMELDAIAACVIGGTSLKGGKGNVLGVLIGALLMATLLSGMTLLAYSPETKFIARGTVLALAVWMDIRLSRGGFRLRSP